MRICRNLLNCHENNILIVYFTNAIVFISTRWIKNKELNQEHCNFSACALCFHSALYLSILTGEAICVSLWSALTSRAFFFGGKLICWDHLDLQETAVDTPRPLALKTHFKCGQYCELYCSLKWVIKNYPTSLSCSQSTVPQFWQEESILK